MGEMKMEKLIKIKARFSDGSVQKYRTTNFTVKPFRDAASPANVGKPSGLYIKLDDGYTFACRSIEVEQKEIESAFTIAINSFGITEKDYEDVGLKAPKS